jgi:hypothetical protein
MKKLTKIEMFTKIMKGLTNADEIAFIEHEIELLENKKASVRKPTATQIANETFKKDIVKFLQENDGKFTITEMIENCNALYLLTNQRVSALVSQLVNDNILERIEEKRKAYFTIKK